MSFYCVECDELYESWQEYVKHFQNGDHVVHDT